MCAKPVLDIVAGHPAHAAGVPGREFFRRGQPRAYHVHLVEAGGSLWCDYLAFRDYLRAHTEAARDFADVKRALAARFPRDREAYIDAKSAAVREILRLARRGG